MTIAYGRFSLTMLKESVQETAKITAMAMVTIVGAVCFTALFHSMDGDQIIVDFVSHLNLNKWGVYLVIMVLTFVLGAFIDWIAIVLILFPIFLPLIRQYDLDPLWVITCVAVMLQTAFLTRRWAAACSTSRAWHHRACNGATSCAAPCPSWR